MWSTKPLTSRLNVRPTVLSWFIGDRLPTAETSVTPGPNPLKLSLSKADDQILVTPKCPFRRHLWTRTGGQIQLVEYITCLMNNNDSFPKNVTTHTADFTPQRSSRSVVFHYNFEVLDPNSRNFIAGMLLLWAFRVTYFLKYGAHFLLTAFSRTKIIRFISNNKKRDKKSTNIRPTCTT